MGRRRDIAPPAPATPPDLSSIHINSLRGKRVSEVADVTLKTGEEINAHWAELRPIVQKLTETVKSYVNGETIDGPEAVKVLTSIAVVVDKVAKAAQAVLKASEGQSRLAILLQGGVPSRPDPRNLSEKKRAEIVIAAVRQMYQETKVCPVCSPPPIDVHPNGAAA